MSEQEGAAVRFPPPFVPLIALALGLVIELFIPLAITRSGMRWGFGALLTVAGLALLGLAFGWFRKTGQDPKPWTEAPELIVEGVYRWTRNPMYLGMGFLQAGLGLFCASLWPLVLVPLAWWTIYLIAIRHEEAYLREKFGKPYEAYCMSVRRWI